MSKQSQRFLHSADEELRGAPCSLSSDKPCAAAGPSGPGPGDETGGGSQPRYHLLNGNQRDVAQWRRRDEHNRLEDSGPFWFSELRCDQQTSVLRVS